MPKDTQLAEKTIINNATCFDTGVEVDNYPWGYTLKTKRRYWVETKKGKGQRFCYATLNPKNGKWCKPKCSTYESIILITKDLNTGYISSVGLGKYSSDPDFLAKFATTYWEILTDFQKAEICKHNAYNEVMKDLKVTFKINHNPTEESRKKQKETEDKIFSLMNYKAHACITKNKLKV